MVSLQQWKEKLLDILDDTFYRKSEIDEKENILNGLINEKLNISDAFSGDYNDLINKPGSSQVELIHFKEDISSDGIYFYVELPLTLTVSGNSITFFNSSYVQQSQEMDYDYWLEADSAINVLIDWGDGSIDTLPNLISDSLTHIYTDGLTSHDITFKYDYLWVGPFAFSGCSIEKAYIPTDVSIGDYSFFESYVKDVIINNSSVHNDSFTNCSQLESIKIHNAKYIGQAFTGCENLTSVSIPDTVTFMNSSFNGCNILDYQLYWTGDSIIDWDSDAMPANENTIFTIPHGEMQNYIDKDYPEDALVERS